MQITPRAVEDFTSIYKEVFDEELSPEAAIEAAARLATLYERLAAGGS
jgi:hypothetical protein